MLLASGMFCFRVGTGPFSNGLLSTYYVPATVLAPEPLVVNRLHASLLTGPPDRLLSSYSPCASTFCKTWFILKELLDLLLKMEHLCPTWILKWMISVWSGGLSICLCGSHSTPDLSAELLCVQNVFYLQNHSTADPGTTGVNASLKSHHFVSKSGHNWTHRLVTWLMHLREPGLAHCQPAPKLELED